jgi:hypothetical protein
MQFVAGLLLGLCLGVAWSIHQDIDRLTQRIQVDTEITKKIIRQRTESLGCELQLGSTQKQLADCMSIVGKVDYILWEVHALKKDPGRLEPESGDKLCAEVGSHSTLRAGTTLRAYNFWNEPDGQPMLGCRYTKGKEEP